jgi:hypothetical protein
VIRDFILLFNHGEKNIPFPGFAKRADSVAGSTKGGRSLHLALSDRRNSFVYLMQPPEGVFGGRLSCENRSCVR